MATKAKLEGNARYLAKMKSVSLRMKPEDHEEIKCAAEKSYGGSVQGYILDAVRERMAEDSKAGITVCKFKNAALEPHAQAAGQSIKEYIAQAVQERILKDSRE